VPLFQWTKDLSVNIVEIDNQHKKLIELINLLHDSMKAGKGKDILGKILTDLADYTVYHFGTEEKMFQKYKYPASSLHKKEHDDLTKQVMDIKAKLDAGKSVITMEIMTLLKDWLSNHILQTDKRYSAFFNSNGVR